MFSRLLFTTFCCFALVVVSGCAALPVGGLIGEKVEFADARNPAAEIVCLWESGKGNTSDGKPSRGFNGTILFFDRAHAAPIGVHGKLTFYLYDDYGPPETWSEPIAEYSFSAEEWQHFFEVGTLGPCYRIFIPYPRQHPYQVNASLWVKYEPADGQPAFYSQKSTVVLAGMFREREQAKVMEIQEIRDRSPDNLQGIVADSLAEEHTPTRRTLAETLHRWDVRSQASTIQLMSHEVTQEGPAGAHAGPYESAPGAGAESWGSTPPALSSHSETSGEPPRVRKRFKLTAPE
jgi:hypothetical protein